MDEMLSMALWIMAGFMLVSGAIIWFNSQPGIADYHLGLNDYHGDLNALDANDYRNATCEMTSLFEAPGYAWCFLGTITTPILNMVTGIWNLLFNWQNLLHMIFVNVPAGDLFETLLTPILTIIEIGAVIIILMRLAAIIRGVAGGFL